MNSSNGNGSNSDLSGEAVNALKTGENLIGRKEMSPTINKGTEKCCIITDEGRCITKCH